MACAPDGPGDVDALVAEIEADGIASMSADARKAAKAEALSLLMADDGWDNALNAGGINPVIEDALNRLEAGESGVLATAGTSRRDTAKAILRAPPVAYAPGYGAIQHAQPASSARTPPQPHSIRSGLRALGQPVPERGGAHTRNAVAQLKSEVAVLCEALEHQQREYQAALAKRKARIASAETLAAQLRAAGADAVAAAQKAAHASTAAQIEAQERVGAAKSRSMSTR
ncbi:hypothetical protein Rhopal_007305-T1 [Rhodotorula paludigena]|uniref:Uncharacterized protein n=1 Tax=Rhodotorula paludigena TaxID=86838 RepID=A0AAV5GNR4_9BASI|nr:hypothetical protein Rhopal_007305-T1 [Rhodotorula paludigena]